MRRIVGTIMVISGIVIAPIVWDEIGRGGLRPRIVFAGAVASIATGLAISVGTKQLLRDLVVTAIVITLAVIGYYAGWFHPAVAY